MHSLSCKYPRSLTCIVKYAQNICVKRIRLCHGTGDRDDRINHILEVEDFDIYDRLKLSSIKKQRSEPLKDEFRTPQIRKHFGDSPLKGIKSKNKKSSFNRPPTNLIESDQADQLNDIKNWFKTNTHTKVDVEANIQKWKQASQTKEFGFSTEGDVLYGIHPVINALRYKKRSLYKLYLQNRVNLDVTSPAIDEIVSVATELQIPMQSLPRQLLDRVSNKRPHQGVCLDVSPLPELLHSIENDAAVVPNADHHPLWLVLYKIKDPMNLGAILRSAHFLAVDRVIRTRNDSCPLTPVVSKASSGALESMPLYTVNFPLTKLIKAQREKGWKIVGTSAPSECDRATTPVESYSVTRPTLLFIGNEGSGIPDSIHDQCDDVLTIESPEHADVTVNSLNVSVAAGIILQNLLSRR